MTDRYDRQERIPRWRQAALRDARVLILGAGALGNEILKNLALMGVGNLLVVDFDHVERSNLSRSVLFRDADIGRSKAETAARAAAALNPDIRVHARHADLTTGLGLGAYRRADLVVGGLDGVAARSHAGIRCNLAGTPFLDGGMWSLGGEVRRFAPGEAACFDCTLAPEDRDRALERRSCTGFRAEVGPDPPTPATAATTAVIGGLAAMEAAAILCGWSPEPGAALVFNGLAKSLHETRFSRDPDCAFHRPPPPVTETAFSAETATPRDLLAPFADDSATPPALELGRDFLLGFHCPDCGREEPVNALVAHVDEARIVCPRCGGRRRANRISRVEPGDAAETRPLAQLGVPPGEILALRAGETLHFLELTPDITTLWP